MHAQKNRRADQWLFCFAVALSTVFAPALARGTPSPNDGIWTELVPTAVSSTCAIVDPVRHRLVFFGGDSEGATSRSVWALSLEGTPVWTVLTPVGPGPEARYGHSAIYDPVRDRMIIFGGYSHGTETYHDDVWALSLSGPSTWTQIQPSGALPAGRFDHSAIYDPVQDRMVVFGGHNLPHYARSDLWSLNLAGAPAWSELTVAGASPGGRSSHTAVYDPLHRQMILCGGNTSPSVNSSQSWTLSLGDSMAWSLVAVAAAPPGRARVHFAGQELRRGLQGGRLHARVLAPGQARGRGDRVRRPDERRQDDEDEGSMQGPPPRTCAAPGHSRKHYTPRARIRAAARARGRC